MSDGNVGLVHRLLLDGVGGARSLDDEAVASWKAEDGVLWVHVDLGQETGREWIEAQGDLDRAVVAALLAERTRPYTETIGDGLLGCLRGVNLNPGHDPEDMVAIRFWTDGRRIISSRRRRLLSVQDLTDRLAAAHGPRNAGEWLVGLVTNLLGRIADVVVATEDLAGEIEEEALSGTSPARRAQLADLRRQVIALRRFLGPQREAMSRLLTESVDWLERIHLDRLRETSNSLTRHIEDLDAVRECATVTQDQIDMRLSEQLNRRMYLLSVIAAIFLPLGFLTGLLGVNLRGIPGAEHHYGFGFFAFGLIVLGALVAFAFARGRWL